MRKFVAIAAALAISTPAFAQSVHKRLEEGNQLLRNGNAEGALAVYRDIMTDEPGLDVLQYAVGATHYQKALQLMEDNAPQDSTAALDEAGESFKELATSNDPFVRRNVDYNVANTMALKAKQTAGIGNHEETIEAFEQAIHGYEDVLRVNPDHQQAKANLDHMRYLLKKMMQNPPPQNNEGNEQQQGDQQDDSDQQNQQQQDQQQQQQQDQQQGNQEQEQEGQQSEQQSSGAPSGENAPDRETIEAILESLEDLDNREQRSNRNRRSNVRILKNWW